MNENALVRKWSPLATTISREFFHPTLDSDDLRQEALIAVMEAGRKYDPSRGISFGAFASMFIKRRLATTLKTANRMKRDWRMEAPRETRTEDGEALQTVELVPARNADPHDLTCIKDDLANFTTAMRTLSPLERHWMLYVIDGGEYSSAIDGKRNKVAENAVDRARAKLLRLAA